MLRRELSRSLHREYSTNQDHLGLSLFRKGGPLATHYYLVWAYRAKCALVHLLHLQVGSSGGLGGLGIALQQLFHHCDSLSQASVKFKVTDKGLSNGGRALLQSSGTAICNGLLLHTSASLAKTLTFTKKES